MDYRRNPKFHTICVLNPRNHSASQAHQTHEAGEKVVETSQIVADKADDIADNIKSMTSLGGIARSYLYDFIGHTFFKKKKRRSRDADD
jgi:hypothetical protein